MSKEIITRLFIGGIVAVVAGLVAGFVGVWLAFANGSFVMNGPDVTGVVWTPTSWAMVGLAAIGCLAMVGGAVASLVAWIGALINTSYLEDKAWFVLLLVLGLLSFGFVAMIAYVIAGPDGTKQREIRQVELRPTA